MSAPTKLLNLSEIINDRRFSIPEYQRGYSWEQDQLEDLRKDIENLYGTEHKHYTGTIVATDNNPGNAGTFEIVDGQQRLTTLTILVKEIIDSDTQKYSYLKEQFILRGSAGNEKMVLEPNYETRQFFKDVVLNNQNATPIIKSHQCILTAKKFFRKWLSDCPDKKDDILKIATHQLGFIFFTPDYEKEIGIMFEVINNRGKSLSQLEKIKNYLIYWSTIKQKDSLREEINERWVNIQKNLNNADKTSNQDEDSFLRNCYIVYFDTNKEKSWYVYDQLKDRFNPKETDEKTIADHTQQIQGFLKFLEDASLHYSWFFKKNEYLSCSQGSAENHRIDKAITQLRCQPAIASVMPLYLAIMSRLDRPGRVADLLELLERMNFRVYTLPKITSRADSKQGDTFWFAHALYWNRDWLSEEEEQEYTKYGNREIHGDIFDWLEMQMVDFTKYFCPEKKFIQALTLDSDEGDDYYRWNGIRYFLANYEAEKRRELGLSYDLHSILIGRNDEGRERNDHLSLEHVWATNNRSKEYEGGYIEKRRLGNFVLLGLSSNISLSDNDIPAKIDELKDWNSKNSGALLMAHIRELVDDIYPKADPYIRAHVYEWKRITSGYYEQLSTFINDERENRLIRFALQRWAVKGEELKRFVKVDTFEAMNRKMNENYFLHET